MGFLDIARGVVLAALFSLGGIAADGSSEEVSPLSWEKECLEFKPAPGTNEIRGAFRFTNRSQSPVVFCRITPNCSCLKIVGVPKETAAGQTGTIEFSYEATGKEGVQTARIEVQSGGATTPLQTLRIRLELSPRLTVRPGIVIWEKSSSKEVSIEVIDPTLHLAPKVDVTGDFVAVLSPAQTARQFRLRLERPSKPGPAEGWATLTFADDSNKPVERKVRLIAY